MDDYVRQCALPGCDVPIDDIPGRPARRYCTAAHRAAARQARRASIQPEQRVRLAATLPWLREPDPEPVLVRPAAAHAEPARVPAPRPASPARRSLAARLGDHLPRRRRAIAVIGAAGILAGSYAVTSSQSTEIAGPSQQTPRGETSDGWAARAQVTLTSVDKQLDTIARTEAAWNALPEHAAVGTPAPVAELMDRKALLERRKAALQSQLDTYRALARTKADLELSEQNLDAVEKALRSAPTTGVVSSPDEATALAALQEQRDLRIRQRDAKKLELAGIEGNVEKAARAPLPDDGQQTTAVSAKVMDVIHNGGRDGGGPTSPAPGPRRPEVLAGGREGEQAQERRPTTTSAPPDPRGPRDESAERRAEPRPAAAPKGPVATVVDTVDGVLGGGTDPQTGEQRRGPVGKVADTVSGVLGGGKQEAEPAAEAGPAGDRSEDKPARPPRGPVGKVVDTVGGAVEGLIGGNSQKENAPGESVQKESTQKESTQKESTQEESTRKESPQRERPEKEGSPRTSAENDDTTQARSAPAGTPGRGDLATSMPGAALAMAIVHSVPGGEAAAPAVEAALRQAAARYAEQAGSPEESPSSRSSGSPSSSRRTPARATTTVADDSGSTSTSRRSGSDSSSGEWGSASTTSRSGSKGSSSTSGSEGGSDRSSGSKDADSGSWDSTGWDSTGWDSKGSDASSRDTKSSTSKGRDSGSWDTTSWDSKGSDSGSWDTKRSDASSWDTKSSDASSWDTKSSATRSSDAKGSDPTSWDSGNSDPGRSDSSGSSSDSSSDRSGSDSWLDHSSSSDWSN